MESKNITQEKHRSLNARIEAIRIAQEERAKAYANRRPNKPALSELKKISIIELFKSGGANTLSVIASKVEASEYQVSRVIDSYLTGLRKNI